MRKREKERGREGEWSSESSLQYPPLPFDPWASHPSVLLRWRVTGASVPHQICSLGTVTLPHLRLTDSTGPLSCLDCHFMRRTFTRLLTGWEWLKVCEFSGVLVCRLVLIFSSCDLVLFSILINHPQRSFVLTLNKAFYWVKVVKCTLFRLVLTPFLRFGLPSILTNHLRDFSS